MTPEKATDNQPYCETSRTISLARFGGAFNRNFKAECGSVEVTPGVSEPQAQVTTKIITSAIGTEAQFYAVRASISVYHAPSHTVVTQNDCMMKLPIDERAMASLHADETWLTPEGVHRGKSLEDIVRQLMNETARKGQELSKVWHAMNSNVDQSAMGLRQALSSFMDELRSTLVSAVLRNS